MKCEQCRPLIEEFVDLELKSDTSAGVAKHLEECSECAAIAANLQVEQQAYAKYDAGVQVSPALWAGVQQRLTASSIGGAPRLESLSSRVRSLFALPRLSWLATAALVLIAVGLTVVVMNYRQGRATRQTVVNNTPAQIKPAELKTPVGETTPGSNVASVVADKAPVVPKRQRQPPSHIAVARLQVPGAVKTPSQLVHEAEEKYLAAIAMLSRNGAAKRSHIDPQTLARLDQAIASIDRTIAGTRKAVRMHPDDPLVVQYMLSAYARKVDVLREINAF